VKTEILILRDMSLYRFAFYLWRNRPNVAWSTSLLKFLDHTQLYTSTHTHTPARTPLNEWSPRRRRRYLYNTQQT